MRKSRYQKGSVKKQRGRWVGLWWDNSSHRSRVLGLVKDMTKSEAREAVRKIVAEMEEKRQENKIWRFGEFVSEVYYKRENPRLCRGDSRCLTVPGVHPRNSSREPAKHTEGV